MNVPIVALLTALKVHWQEQGILVKLKGGAHVGDVIDKRERPYASIAPLGGGKLFNTNKGSYDTVVFEVGLVHNTFEETGGSLGTDIRDATRNANLTLETGIKLKEIRATDTRWEEFQGYWVYWQEFIAKVSS